MWDLSTFNWYYYSTEKYFSWEQIQKLWLMKEKKVKKILGRNLFEIKLDRFFCKLILKTSKCFRILQPKVIGDL